jgi:hypothetical protein
MSYRNLLGALLLCFGLLAFASPSIADTVDGITFTLVQADLSGHPGDTLTWEYNIVNASGSDIVADHVDSSVWSSGLGDASVFDFFAGSGFVIPDQSSLMGGTLYGFDSNPAVKMSFNSGQFDLFVVLLDGAFVDLSANYTATIAPAGNVPEPGSLSLLLGGLLLSAFALRRSIR